MSNTHSPGTVIGNRFLIEATAASGGMGTIFRARDLHTEALVALKVLHQSGSQTDDLARFAQEANVLASLRHPAIVRYVAHGQTPSGQHYLAMDWLEGEDLAQRLARQPLTVGESLTLARRAAEALVVAHGRGILHRDAGRGRSTGILQTCSAQGTGRGKSAWPRGRPQFNPPKC